MARLRGDDLCRLQALNWAAGAVDAAAHVYVRACPASNGGSRYDVLLRVTGIDREEIGKRLCDVLHAGTVAPNSKRADGSICSWEWRACGANAATALRQLEQYLICAGWRASPVIDLIEAQHAVYADDAARQAAIDAAYQAFLAESQHIGSP